MRARETERMRATALSQGLAQVADPFFDERSERSECRRHERAHVRVEQLPSTTQCPRAHGASRHGAQRASMPRGRVCLFVLLPGGLEPHLAPLALREARASCGGFGVLRRQRVELCSSTSPGGADTADHKGSGSTKAFWRAHAGQVGALRVWAAPGRVVWHGMGAAGWGEARLLACAGRARQVQRGGEERGGMGGEGRGGDLRIELDVVETAEPLLELSLQRRAAEAAALRSTCVGAAHHSWPLMHLLVCDGAHGRGERTACAVAYDESSVGSGLRSVRPCDKGEPRCAALRCNVVVLRCNTALQHGAPRCASGARLVVHDQRADVLVEHRLQAHALHTAHRARRRGWPRVRRRQCGAWGLPSRRHGSKHAKKVADDAHKGADNANKGACNANKGACK